MSGGVATGGTGEARVARLERAADEVAAVLEHVDLGAEAGLAEETIAALATLDRARELAERLR